MSDPGLRDSSKWTRLYETDQLLSAKSFDYGRTARKSLAFLLGLAEAQCGALATLDRAGDLVLAASEHVDDEAILDDPRLSGLYERALAEGAPLLQESLSLGSLLREGGPSAHALVLPIQLRLRPLSSAEEPVRERRRHPPSLLAKPLGVVLLTRRDLAFSQRELLHLARAAEHLAEVLTNATLFHEATHDPLTDLYRRPELERHLQVETRLASHTHAPLALLMVDIDDLGRLNQSHGRQHGDKVIARVARLVRAQVREEDACIRYGGEEFAVVLPGTDTEGALAAGEKIRAAVESYPGFGAGAEVRVSVGVAMFPAQAESPEKLLRKADQTLFMAKQEGGNRVLLWHRRIPRHALRSDKLIGIITGNHLKDYRNVMALLDTIVVVNSLLERKQVLTTLLDMMIHLSSCERGVLYLEENGALKVEVAQDARGRSTEPEGVCDPVLARVHRQSMPLFVRADDEESEAKLGEAARAAGLELVLCLPLLVKGKLIGCLYLDTTQTGCDLEESDLIFMQALSRELGNALEKARLYQENLEQKQALEELTAQLAQKVQAQASELKDLERKHSQLKLRFNYDKIVGKSEAMLRVFKLLDRITDTDVPVLVQGETGTGKELVARALHVNGPRRDGPFVSVNCSAIAESLLESELFGHVKGSFTGADRDKAGLFEQAHGGTIFLDEVQDMMHSMQRELLRVLQEGEIRRVGGKDIIHVDVRVISATNKDLRELVKRNEFRQDLFYRLNVVGIELPPLRDRKEDIPLIVQKLLESERTPDGRPIKLAKDALRAILRHDWPGNVRQLQNMIEKACLLSDGDTIHAEQIRMDGESTNTSGVSRLFDQNYADAKQAFAREYLKNVLARNGGNVTRAAQEAGVVRSSFHKMMRKHDLSAKDFGASRKVTRD